MREKISFFFPSPPFLRLAERSSTFLFDGFEGKNFIFYVEKKSPEICCWMDFESKIIEISSVLCVHKRKIEKAFIIATRAKIVMRKCSLLQSWDEMRVEVEFLHFFCLLEIVKDYVTASEEKMEDFIVDLRIVGNLNENGKENIEI